MANLSRTWYNTLVDDSGLGLDGTPWDKAAVDSLMDAIDAALVGVPSDWVNVMDTAYGAVGDGVTDDTAAFQAAIDAAAHGTLYIPHASYRITSTLTVATAVRIIGAGMRGTALVWDGGADVMLHVTDAVDNVEISSLHLENEGTATILLQIDCVRFVLHRIFSQPVVAPSVAAISTSTSFTTYHGVLRDCYIASKEAGEEIPIGFYGARGHTMIVDGCMFSGCTRGIVAGGGGGNTVFGFSIVNTRLESFSGTSASYPGTVDDIGIDVVNVDGLNISGCNFGMAGDTHASSAPQRGIKLQTVRGGLIAGNVFSGEGQCTAAVNVASSACVGVRIAGNLFYSINGYGIEATGSGSLSLLEIGINSAPSPTTGVFNNTWTPGLSFGGGTTGITYAANGQVGTWQRVGNNIVIRAYIELTNKGSSTGTVRITGFPRASATVTNGDTAGAVVTIGLSSISGAPQLLMQASSSVARLFYTGTGSLTELTEANFNNTSGLTIQITYPVNGV